MEKRHVLFREVMALCKEKVFTGTVKYKQFRDDLKRVFK